MMTQWLKKITVAALLLAVVFGFYNTLARYIDKFLKLQWSSNAYLDIQWQLFSLVFFGGILWIHYSGTHIKIDLLSKKKKPNSPSLINICINMVLGVPFASIVSYVCWKYFLHSLKVFEGASQPDGLPVFYIKILPALCFSILTIMMLSQYIKQLYIHFNKKDEHELV